MEQDKALRVTSPRDAEVQIYQYYEKGESFSWPGIHLLDKTQTGSTCLHVLLWIVMPLLTGNACLATNSDAFVNVKCPSGYKWWCLCQCEMRIWLQTAMPLSMWNAHLATNSDGIGQLSSTAEQHWGKSAWKWLVWSAALSFASRLYAPLILLTVAVATIWLVYCHCWDNFVHMTVILEIVLPVWLTLWRQFYWCESLWRLLYWCDCHCGNCFTDVIVIMEMETISLM